MTERYICRKTYGRSHELPDGEGDVGHEADCCLTGIDELGGTRRTDSITGLANRFSRIRFKESNGGRWFATLTLMG